MPLSDAGSVSLEQVIEKPGSVRRTVSAVTGMDRVTLNKFAVAQDWMGNPYNTKDYWVTEAQSSLGAPLDPDEPGGVLLVQGLTGNVAYTLVTKITYNIQFFDLEVAPVSLLKAESSDDESLDPVKPPVRTPVTSRLSKK